ncbi:uncharacterized protein LOC126789853 isoform X2 [Argentina anserina]|uniref:uncharacterized protein LOC126789853 isoform X2 n=1 Tax=Argentina anserina TaxID=57926 RepID=UPI0021762C84|nr:uncharacterized protein LOC126789853 isoform X2 [Potentilla anserina]
MTMVPSAHHQNLSRQQQQHPHLHGGYGGCGANYYNNTAPDDESFGGLLMSQVEEVVINGPMAEDESRTNSLNNEAEAEAGSSSKALVDEDQRDDRWLQLSIGGHNATSADVQAPETRSLLRGSSSASGLIELDLLSANISSPSSSTSWQFQLQQAARSSMTPMFHVPDHHHQIRVPNFSTNMMSTTSNLYFQHPGIGMGMSSSLLPSFPQHQHQEVNWGFRPLIPHHNNHIGNSASTSSSSSSFIQLEPSSSTSYFARPFQLQHHYLHHGGGAGPSLDFRVVDPPRRPQSGIWFMLQASQNQEKEPFLPQIPKSYLRIKDGRMTVRLIKKYLVNKLRLDSESEVEITCRGQQLLPFLTLQHVRDNIWSLRDAAAASLTLLPLPDSTSTTTDDHVMVLHYARTSLSSTTA